MSASQQLRSYAAAHFALELGGNSEDIGLFRSMEGGGVRADPVSQAVGGYAERQKFLGKPKYEDLRLQIGMAMSKPFYTWLEEFFAGQPSRKDGAIVAADFYYAERARRNFKDALIREIQFPRMAADDKGPAYMTVGLSVEDLQFVSGSGAKLQPPKGFDKQKMWTACNFSMTIDGYEMACRRITRIESFAVKQNIIEHHVGGMRAPLKQPTVVEFPNLVFSLPAVDAAPLYGRWKEFGDRGAVPAPLGGDKGGTNTRLTGQIFAQDNGRNNLFSVEFRGADIVNIAPDKLDAGTEEIAQVKVELYVESMKFTFLQGRGGQ